MKVLPASITVETNEEGRPCTACLRNIDAGDEYFVHSSETASFCTEKCVTDSKEGIENLDEMLELLEEDLA